MLAFEDRINRARILLERKGSAPREFLSAEIQESWGRCLNLGLDPLAKPEHILTAADELGELRAANETMLRLAAAEVQNLHSQISGTNFAIVFANRDGIILESIADDSFGSIADANRITPGSLWREAINGTNALGDVVQSHRPSTVHAGEHFFRCFKDLTCVAAPVFDPRGELIGVIDASSDCRTRQHHTHVLVKMSSLTVENGLFRHSFRDKMIIEMHSRHEFLGTLQAGLMAFDEAGWLCATNRQARFLLHGISLSPGVHFDEIFRTRFRTFLDTRNKIFGTQLVDLHGSTFAVTTFLPATLASRRKDRVEPQPDSVRVHDDLPRMVCGDPAVRMVMAQVERASRLNVPIHIRGETGTGKEMLALFAHQASGRSGEFIGVNCAALPENLLESELFGYHGGAFTGADKGGAQGLVLQADGGTLFLDEIGEMPRQFQATLLRFLDGWRVRPVGGTVERQVDVQLVTATNRDLQQAVLKKKFRADLLYRINTVEVQIPPLRKRTDLPEIVAAILETLEQQLHFEPGALDALQDALWPGNIRELRNCLVRFGIGATDGVVAVHHVRNVLGESFRNKTRAASADSLLQRERDIVLEVFERHSGNVSAVARELGISRNTVYKKLKEGRSPPETSYLPVVSENSI